MSITFPTLPLLASAVLITTRQSKINKESNRIAKAIQIQWMHSAQNNTTIDYRLLREQGKTGIEQIPNSNWATRICNETNSLNSEKKEEKNRKRIKFSVPGLLLRYLYRSTLETHLVVDFKVLIEFLVYVYYIVRSTFNGISIHNR